MKHTQHILSLPGLAFSLVLAAILGLSLWRQGGLVFSPGAVSAQESAGITLKGFRSHAEFEGQCEYCHQPLRTVQATLCNDCHTGIAEQIRRGEGLHARISGVESCSACHAEHRGRAFNLTNSAAERFDHSITAFDLIHHQVDYSAAPLSCAACHTERGRYTTNEDTCRACHARHAPDFIAQHDQEMGHRCLACHDGSDRMEAFDHSQTTFPLAGKHVQATCAACHYPATQSMGLFAGLRTECAACHAEPEIHRGLFDTDCARCHTAEGWRPATLDGAAFDHLATTGFSLARHTQDYRQQSLTCQACHPAGLRQFTADTCSECHTGHDAVFMAGHSEKYGAACTDCHDGVDRMQGFDHALVFALDGKHAEIECTACHAERRFAGTPNTCIACHAEPEIHAGVFGESCESCHTTTAWRPAYLKQHNFPLDHGESGTACQTCHPSAYSEYTCYGCHKHQEADIRQKHAEENISPAELPNCVTCHPTGHEEDD